MFDFETTVSGIEFKVRQLAEEVQRLRQSLLDKEEECAALKEALENKEITINNLKEENRIVKLGNRLTEKEDNVEMKLKINQMIRAIDKSLAILKSDAEGEK